MFSSPESRMIILRNFINLYAFSETSLHKSKFFNHPNNQSPPGGIVGSGSRDYGSRTQSDAATAGALAQRQGRRA